MVYIEVPDMNDSIGRLELDGKQYHIRFTYNDRYQYWSFSLYDDQRNPLLSMLKIVPRFPLDYYYSSTDLPDGYFGCIGIDEPPTRYSFRDGMARFVFISSDEIEE